eukprot:9769934-Ditylum_brightwellii.AAC.2
MDVSDNINRTTEKHITPKEQMKIRGAENVQCSLTYTTPVFLELLVTKTEEIYPLRTKFKELITRIQKDDDSFSIKETLGEDIWTNPEELSSRKKFQETFKVQESNSMCRPPKIVLCCTFISTKKVGNMKFKSRLFAYLNAYKIYIGFDKLETEGEGSPGFITGLHPKLTDTVNLNVTLHDNSTAVEFEDDATRDGGHSKEVLQELIEFV